MQAWDSIQTTLKWIDENLSEHIEIDILANIAHLSPFYYQRLFSRLVGKPVMEYVKLRRLANAAEYLAINKCRIIDVALNFGFDNHETFTRNFKDVYGMTPEDYRAKIRPLSHFLMPDLSMKYHLIDESVPLIADGIILEIHRKVLKAPRIFTGLSIQNPIYDTPGIDFLSELWTRFHDEKIKIEYLIPEENEAGVSYPGDKDGYFSYFAGAEVSKSSEQQEFMSWSMPAGEYAVCIFEAENFHLLTTNALIKARDYMLGVWLPSHKLSCEPFMAELYFDTSPEASKMEIWLKTKSIPSI